MYLDYILWMYILIFIVIFAGLLAIDSELIHAIFFALIVSLIFILIVKPPADVSLETDNIACVMIYFAILFISAISILIYSGVMAYKHLKKPSNGVDLYKKMVLN